MPTKTTLRDLCPYAVLLSIIAVTALVHPDGPAANLLTFIAGGVVGVIAPKVASHATETPAEATSTVSS